MNFPGIFISQGPLSKAQLDEMSMATREWEMQAARGECGWVCADCCATFPEGMPDACAHGQERCTALIQRDKTLAAAPTPPEVAP